MDSGVTRTLVVGVVLESWISALLSLEKLDRHVMETTNPEISNSYLLES